MAVHKLITARVVHAATLSRHDLAIHGPVALRGARTHTLCQHPPGHRLQLWCVLGVGGPPRGGRQDLWTTLSLACCRLERREKGCAHQRLRILYCRVFRPKLSSYRSRNLYCTVLKVDLLTEAFHSHLIISGKVSTFLRRGLEVASTQQPASRCRSERSGTLFRPGPFGTFRGNTHLRTQQPASGIRVPGAAPCPWELGDAPPAPPSTSGMECATAPRVVLLRLRGVT